MNSKTDSWGATDQPMYVPMKIGRFVFVFVITACKVVRSGGDRLMTKGSSMTKLTSPGF